MNNRTYSEHDINVDLNELAHETIRELYLAAKKVSIYSGQHPLAMKAVGNAFTILGRVFRYKKYFNLRIESRNLYAVNIMMKQSIFTDQIMDYMQMLDVNDILLDAELSADELQLFLEKLVQRSPVIDSRNRMDRYLDSKNIQTINVNSDLGRMLFEHGYRFRGDMNGDFSIRSIVGSLIGNDFESMVSLLAAENMEIEEYVQRYRQDYYPQLVAYLIPEKIATLDYEELTKMLKATVAAIIASGDYGEISEEQKEKLHDIIGALNYHPRREEIINELGGTMLEKGLDKKAYSDLLPKTSTIKLETSEKIDQFLYSTFNDALPGYKIGNFKNYFGRLLRTGQQGKAKSVVNILLNHLAGPNLDSRVKALVLFRMGLAEYPSATGEFLIEHCIKKIDEYLEENRETFEFSDLIWELSRLCLAERKYDYLARLCEILLKYRSSTDGILAYDSVAVKKSVEELNRSEVINQLVNEIIKRHQKYSRYLKVIMVTIGSEEAALALSDIISHEQRAVRQLVLKILSEMGKASLTVFSRMLNDVSLFDREELKRDLPDEKWYIVRNAIFVLGSIKDPMSCRALRLRINDPDVRVRRDIIQALEKIGGEEAADLLLVLAADPEHDIREAALIALGFVGHQDIVPELIDLAYKFPTESVNIVNVIGKLGGAEARTFLIRILNERQMQSNFTSGRVSRDDLKLACIKALGRIGDQESINKIEEFNNSLSSSTKIFFGGAKLAKTADDILNRRKKDLPQ